MTTASNTYLGGTGFYLPYTADNSSATLSTSALTLIELGTFATAPSSAAPNGNVTSSFTLSVNTGLSGVSSSVVFTGTIVDNTKTGIWDISFTPGTSYTWSADPNGAATFDVQNVGSCSLPSSSGCYSVAVEPIEVNSMGKTTDIWAFIGPASITAAPEPIPAATTGMATLGLLAFALRRKFRNQLS